MKHSRLSTEKWRYEMKKIMKKGIVCAVATAIVMTSAVVDSSKSSAAVKLNKTSKTIWVGSSFTLKVKGAKKKAKFSSNKKSVASVSSLGVVRGKKAGNAVITAKVGSKKLKCKVTVKGVSPIKTPTNQTPTNQTPTNQTPVNQTPTNPTTTVPIVTAPQESNTNQIANSTLAANIAVSGEFYKANDSILLTVTNANSVFIDSIDVNYILKDTAGAIIETGNFSVCAMQAGGSCNRVLIVDTGSEHDAIPDMSKSTFAVEVTYNATPIYEQTTAVTVTSQQDKEGDIVLTSYNAHTKEAATYVIIYYYDAAGKVIAVDWTSIYTSSGGTEYKTESVPYYDYTKKVLDKDGDYSYYPEFKYASYKVETRSYV